MAMGVRQLLTGPLLLLLLLRAPTPAAAGCAAGEYAAAAEGAAAGCAPCPNGTMSVQDDILPYCPQCPYPSRCLRLGECEDAASACCAGGSAGRGCAECERGFFSVGPKCISCPKSAGKLLPALLAAVAVAVLCLLWCVTGVNLPTDDELDSESLTAVGFAHSEARAAVTDVADVSSEAMATALAMKPSEARGAVDSAGGGLVALDGAAREAQRALSRAAKAMTNGPIFASIGLMHVHLSFHALQLPVGFPDVVQKIAHWAAAAVSFDFGVLTSPECYASKEAGALQVMTGRFLLTNAVFCGFALALALGKLCCAEACTRQRLHSTNALTALYTLSVGALAKSCLHTFDCTQQPQLGYSTLDSDPAIVCDGPKQTEYFSLMAGAGMLGFVLYAVVLPLGLFRRLWRAHRRGVIGSADFLQANAWVVLKYKPSAWWFELPLLAYKLVVISASQLLNSGSEDNTAALLLSLLAATATLLALVVLVRPFRDQFG